MVIKRIRKIKGQLITDIIDQDGPYVEVSSYDIKKKLDEIVETVNSLLDVVELLSKKTVNQRIIIVVDPEIPVDENGHDEACNTGIGMDCDCWRNEEVRETADKAMAKMKGK